MACKQRHEAKSYKQQVISGWRLQKRVRLLFNGQKKHQNALKPRQDENRLKICCGRANCCRPRNFFVLNRCLLSERSIVLWIALGLIVGTTQNAFFDFWQGAVHPQRGFCLQPFRMDSGALASGGKIQ
ncbi:hypothetical protein HNY73_001110 [Argiope bruennichi]|uniref:Uncharacterized protein n=1 Tax=Argiope bruennichi TaxID=94029 RepID=A0A8T0G4H4_ARGBR|nr:hypothetical protein HNY73_001110 [Argiope bruennichi]